MDEGESTPASAMDDGNECDEDFLQHVIDRTVAFAQPAMRGCPARTPECPDRSRGIIACGHVPLRALSYAKGRCRAQSLLRRVDPEVLVELGGGVPSCAKSAYFGSRGRRPAVSSSSASYSSYEWRSDDASSLQGIEIGIRTEILQLASDFRLLGLLTAAPHGVDPPRSSGPPKAVPWMIRMRWVHHNRTRGEGPHPGRG